MARATVLGKRKIDSELTDGVETRKRRVLRSSFNDENADPAILQDANEDADELLEPGTPSKRISRARAPAKHSGSAKQAVLSPAKISGNFKAPKPHSNNITTPEKRFPLTPQTPRHRDAFAKPDTPRHRVQVATRFPLTPRTPRTPRTPSSGSTSVYNAARQLFARSAAPGKLIGRESESAELKAFLDEGISLRAGRCLYVSGPPGTGKSAFVQQICEEFKGQAGVRAGYLNCMSVKSTKELTSNLIRELMGTEEGGEEEAKIAGRDGMSVLKSILFPSTASDDTVYVLAMDEIDHLLTLDLEILYTIFAWALNPASRLILVGIANAIDLTERFLPRLKSRNLQPRLLPFVPYTVSQIAAVVNSRLQSLPSANGNLTPFVHPAAVQFCAKKVASQTGDLRKAFDLIRRTIDAVESETKAAAVAQQQQQQQQASGSPLSENNNLSSSPVKDGNKRPDNPLAHLTPETAPRATIAHAAKAVAAVFNNGTAQRLKALNPQQKAALCALLYTEKKNEAARQNLLSTVPSTPSKSASRPPTVRSLFTSYVGLSRGEGGLDPLKLNDFVDVMGSLEALGLVRGASSRGSAGLKGRQEDRGIVSAVSEAEVRGCLQGAFVGLIASLEGP